MHRFSALLPLAVGLTLAAAPAAHAAEFTVNTTADGADASGADGTCSSNAANAIGKCTIRAAIGQAVSVPGPDHITVPSGTFQLLAGFGDLVVNSSLTIDGAGARATVIRATPGARVMTASANLNLRDLSLTGGSLSSAGAKGGGGLLVTGGDAFLERVRVADNTIRGTFNVTGGGIAATGGSLTVLDSTVSGNAVYGKIDGATQGSALGGGIHAGAPTVVRRSTIAGNSTFGYGPQEFSVGGGVYVSEDTVLDHVTLADNVSATVNDSSGFRQGGNLYANSTVTLSGSVLTGGAALNGPNCFEASGDVVETSRNLSSNADCLGAGSLKNADPKLGALADNGGPTDTLRPATASAAVDGATACGVRTTDQRGNALPAAGCDLGAVELGADRRVSLQTSTTAPAAGEELTLVATVMNDGLDTAPAEQLTITLPSGTTVTSASSSAGTCTTGGTITCAIGAMLRTGSATVLATVRATGAAGTITATRGGALPDHVPANDAASVTLSAGPVITTGGTTGTPGPTGSGGTELPGDQPRPVPPIEPAAVSLTGLALAKKPTTKKGAELRFTLSAPAKVKVVTERLLPGRLKGATCKTGRTKGKRCTKSTITDTRDVTLPAGPARVVVAKRGLRAGKVRFTVTPSGGAAQALTAAVRKR